MFGPKDRIVVGILFIITLFVFLFSTNKIQNSKDLREKANYRTVSLYSGMFLAILIGFSLALTLKPIGT